MTHSSPPSAGGQSNQGAAPPVISSRDLLGDHREIVISHGESLYRLRLTNNDKLILFK